MVRGQILVVLWREQDQLHCERYALDPFFRSTFPPLFHSEFLMHRERFDIRADTEFDSW